MMQFSSRGTPPRPSLDLLGSSASTGTGIGLSIEDEQNRADDEGETVESVMTKLAIERRVQYGAEKMLDVIGKRNGNTDGGDQQVKERITAQLEATTDHIKMLEARLERLRGGTQQRPRRRQQPRLNGYASTSSLGQGLSTSLASSTLLSSSSRPRLPRQGSSLTPDRDRDQPGTVKIGQGNTTPSRGPLRPDTSPRMGKDRSASPEGDSFGDDNSLGGDDFRGSSSRLGWQPERTRSGVSSPSASPMDHANTAALVESVSMNLRRLRDGAKSENGKGKSPERGGDEAWDSITRITEMIKKSDYLRTNISVEDVIRSVLPYMGDSSNSRRRSAGYRLFRYIVDRSGWGAMLQAGIEWLIIRTFTRDAKAVVEREQALRLLRTIISLPPSVKTRSPSTARSQGSPMRRDRHSREGSSAIPDRLTLLMDNRIPLTEGLVRAIVSVAENPDDAMRTVCMETLVEIGVLDLPCLLRSDALRTILLTFKDGPSELGPAITGLLLCLVNQPSTRNLLVPGSDLETVLVGLTEEYGKISSRQVSKHMEKLQNCVRNVSMLLGSWAGLLYLCMDDCRAIKSLISSLHVPITEMRDAILDLMFSSLRIKLPSWMNAFLDGRRLTVYNRTQEASSQLQEDGDEEEPPQNLNLVDHFVALLLAVFIESGLLEALMSIIGENNAALNRKATLLLGEILQMANRVLPLQYASQLQSLPRLFSMAAEFSNPAERHAALSALSSIDSLNRNSMKSGIISRDRPNMGSIQDSLQRGQKQVQQVKLRLGLQVEDKKFQQMISDSGVLLGRDQAGWNYEVIMDLVQGPLLNPKRLDEAIKATKFVRRLFSFFHPYNNRFSTIKRTRPNHKWVRLGCALLSTMLVNPEGIRFISEDKLLKQMVECFNELDQYAGQPSPQPVFARDRLENSLAYGYFEMVGVLSKHREGMKLLEKFKFFTCFYHLSELRSRDDIVRTMIECFDYTIDAHPRIVLSKALTSSYMETRLFATHHLGRLLHENPDLTDWALQLMITQLYDTSMEVCDIAVMYLEEACTDVSNLEKVVQLRPTLEHLGDVGHPLFMRFVSTSIGFHYLHQAQFVERELESWLTERNLLYVIEAETFVSKTIRPFSTDSIEDYWTYEGTAPSHFFGELTKTPEGCQLLKEKGIVSDFAEIVRLHGMEGNDQAVLTNVKSVLWALGNIGSTEGGLPFLEDEEIIEVIVEIAEQSPVLTMKGTCFFVIGLISSTRMGAEILEELGWISTRTPIGNTTGLCLPNDIGRFAAIEPWVRPDLIAIAAPRRELSGSEGEIMTAISNLSNYVLAAGAMNSLRKIRNKHPRYFGSITLFHRALQMISSSHYQAPVRRFILELFEVKLEAETLTKLRHLDQSTNNTTPSSSQLVKTDGRREEPMEELAVQHGSDDDEEENPMEYRRRSASSPGPEPLTRQTRVRGLTISSIRPGGGEGEVGVPRERINGFGVAAR